MSKESLLSEALRLPTNSIEYYVGQQLAALFPRITRIHGSDSLFNLEEYALSGQCSATIEARVFSDVITHWRGQKGGVPDPQANALRMSGVTPVATWSEKGLMERARNAWFAVTWQGHELDVIVMNYGDMFTRSYHYWILAENRAVAEDFLVAVCEYNVEVRGEVLVFDGGCWSKDSTLLADIRDATLDNLVLRGTLKNDIHADLVQFFASRDLYQRFRVPWKRGVLFLGPPGNGKTHTVKALINALDQPCLYVKSFKVDFGTDEENIHRVFERARKSAPCILVMEDLDALITPQNRAFFLNELDGFVANAGVVVLATSNHPERLDPSILERPSRFDRKYPFELPALAERQAYIALWNERFEPALRLSHQAITQVAELTDGFSFAYLKELFLSSMMRWIAMPQTKFMLQVMKEQIDTLRAQMVSTTSSDGETPPAAQDTNNPLSTFARMMAASRRASS